jgi:hypothetical protein
VRSYSGWGTYFNIDIVLLDIERYLVYSRLPLNIAFKVTRRAGRYETLLDITPRVLVSEQAARTGISAGTQAPTHS